MREIANQGIQWLNRYGDAFWNFASVMFFQVTILVLVLLAADLLLRSRVRAVFRYWLWLLVLIKLVLPLEFRTPASLAYWLPTGSGAVTQTVDRQIFDRGLDTGPALRNVIVNPIANKDSLTGSAADGPSKPSTTLRDSSPKSQVARTVAAAPIALASLHWRGGLLAAWMFIATVLLSMVWQRGRWVRRLVRQGSDAPDELAHLLQESLVQIGMQPAQVALKVTSQLGSPAICGLWRPTILLPNEIPNRLDRQQLKLVLSHELLHWRRGDLQVNCLQTLLQIFYFYHPAVWLANWMIRRLREQAVDEAVLVSYRDDGQRYCSTLLDIATSAIRPTEAMLSLIGVVESRQALAARIRRIIGRPIPHTARLGRLGLVLILASAVVLLPMGRRELAAIAQANPQAATPSQPAATTTIVMSGRITDETGAPVTDANLQLISIKTYDHSPVAKTDQDGRYAIKAAAKDGEFWVQIESKRWVAATGSYNNFTKVNLSANAPLFRDFTLPRACQMRIQVVNEQREPVPRVQICTALVNDNNPLAGHPGFYTDKNGQVTLSSLPPSPDPRIVGLSSVDYGFAKIILTLNDVNSVPEERIVLKSGEEVKGTATCSDGKPAVGWKVNALPTWWHFGSSPVGQSVTDDGSFMLPHVAPGEYNISISIPQGGGTSMMKPLLSSVTLPPADGPLNLKIDHPSPQGMGSISGTLEFTGGPLQSGMHINAWSEDRKYNSSTFVKPGETRFKIDGLPRGTYQLDYQARDVEAGVVKGIEAPVDDVSLKIVVRGVLTLHGIVVRDDNGQAVPEFRVKVIKERSLRGPNFVQPVEWHEFKSDKGAFAVELVGPGTYRVQVAANGFSAATSESINTDQDLGKELRIPLGADVSLSGLVVDDQGQPVDGAKVVIFLGVGRDSGKADQDVSDITKQGQFTLRHCPLGRQLLLVTHPDNSSLLKMDIDVDPAKPAEPLQLTLRRGATVRGHVFDAQGQPEPNVTLVFQDQRFASSEFLGDLITGKRTIVTDAAGAYKIDHLTPQTWKVSRVNHWQASGVVQQLIVAENGRQQNLDFGGTMQLTGKLIVNGASLANTPLQLSCDGSSFGLPRSHSRTDKEGRFVFFGPPEGKQTLYYSTGDRTRDWVRVRDLQVTSSSADLGAIEAHDVKLTIRCPAPTGATTDSAMFMLHEFDPYWADGHIIVAEGQGHLDAREAFAVEHLPPGKYLLTCRPHDAVQVRKVFEITAADREKIVELKLPHGTASLSGKLDRTISGLNSCNSFKLWSASGEWLTYIPTCDDAGKGKDAYELTNLPAGEYRVKYADISEADTLLTVSLSEGEHKMADITQATITHESKLPQGYASLTITTPDGVPLSGCEFSFPGAARPPVLYSSQYGRLGWMGDVDRYEMVVTYPGFKPLRTTLELVSRDQIEGAGIQVPHLSLSRGE